MPTRAETAAATRRALLQAASDLLDAGGPEAVTLREVGNRAGVSRGAPYGHFADKESLLIAIGVQAWSQMGDQVEALAADESLSPGQKLRATLAGTIQVGRTQPHLYRLMFSNPASDPTALVRAAERAQTAFLTIVGSLVGEKDARRYGALVMSTANGIAGMEGSGQLSDPKWSTSADELVDLLVTLVTGPAERLTKAPIRAPGAARPRTSLPD
jgi:AcrR family transcriptional regulator